MLEVPYNLSYLCYLKTKGGKGNGGDVGNGGSIVIGAHWNTQNTSKYITMCIVTYFDVFCVFQWAPITILPPLGVGSGGGFTKTAKYRRAQNYLLFFFISCVGSYCLLLAQQNGYFFLGREGVCGNMGMLSLCIVWNTLDPFSSKILTPEQIFFSSIVILVQG